MININNIEPWAYERYLGYVQRNQCENCGNIKTKFVAVEKDGWHIDMETGKPVTEEWLENWCVECVEES